MLLKVEIYHYHHTFDIETSSGNDLYCEVLSSPTPLVYGTSENESPLSVLILTIDDTLLCLTSSPNCLIAYFLHNPLYFIFLKLSSI